MIQRLLYFFEGFLPSVQKVRMCRHNCIKCEYYDLCKLSTRE